MLNENLKDRDFVKPTAGKDKGGLYNIIIIIFLVLHVSFTVKPVKINKIYWFFQKKKSKNKFTLRLNVK